MEPNKMISLTFKFAGFWTKVKNEERMKYENGKQRTIKIKLGLINFVQIEQQFKALCPWIEGHDTQLFYHVPRSSPKVYKCLENEDDTIQMIEQIQDIGRVEIVVDTNDTNEVAVHVQNGGGSGDINLHMVDITSAMTSSTSQQAAPIQHEDDLTLLVGARFTTASDFKLALRSHAIKKNFDVKIKASDKKRVIATCAYRGCPWRIRASLCSYSDTFEIRRINVTHICPGINRSGNKQATISWIANEIQGLVKDHPHIPLKQINKNLETTYGLSLPYMKLWRSREIAREIAFRLVDESYSWVPTLKAELLRRNPGSHILYTFDQNDNSTLRFFVSFRVSIEGFLYGCRPLIGVGACYLKSKYLGVLLSANALDGNNDLFTLAFAVVETESKGTWTWFLEQIYQAIGFDLFPLAFISDMEKGIYEAIKEVFPFAEHRVCVRQLWKNLKKYFHHSDGRNTQDLVWAAANAITTLQFDIKMNELSSLFPTIHSYLHKLPYKWSKSQFCNEIKNDSNTNNLSESFNSWIEDARDKPVVDLIDIIRGMLMEQRALRKINGYNWTQDLVPHVEEYIRNITTKREHFIIRQSTVSVFEIEGVTGRYEVDIDARSCSCQVWELTGLPCIHAATFIAMKEHTLWHTYIDNYYHVLRYRLAYEGAISTLPSRDQWQYIDETKAYFLDETKDAIKNITSDCGQMEHEFHTKVEALSGVGQMDSKAQRKALFRSRLKETSQKREKHIDSPLVRYNEDDQPVCRVCNVALKSESLWPAHQASRKHHEAIENIKAAASRQSTSGNSHPERQQNLPEPQAASTLPANFFDSQDTKKQKTVHVKKSSGSGSSYSLVSKEVDQSKTNGRSVQSSKQIGSNDVIQVKAALSEGFSDKGATEEHNSSKKSQISWDDKNLEVKEERGFLPSGFFDRIDSNGVGHSQQLSQQSEKPDIVQLNQVKGPLPEGFFDNKDEDLRARGIEPIRVDIADAYKEFEREIQEDLQEVDDRLEEEEIDAADVREGIESIEHKAYRDRVEIVKKKLIQAKESRLARMHQSPKFRGKNSSDDSSSEDDVYEDFSVDWRAKRF